MLEPNELSTKERQNLILVGGLTCLLFLIMIGLRGCARQLLEARTPEPKLVMVGQVTDFPPHSVTPLLLTATFTDPQLFPEVTPGVEPIPQSAIVTPIPLFLIYDDHIGWRALYRRSPFRGCTVAWEPVNARFADPCHGDKFTYTGMRLEGPASRGMDWFEVQVQADGTVWVDVVAFHLGEELPALTETAVPTRTPIATEEITVTGLAATVQPTAPPLNTIQVVIPVPMPTGVLAQLPPGNLLLFSESQPVENELYWALQAVPSVQPFEQPLFETFYGRWEQMDHPGLYLLNFAPQASPDGRYLALPGVGGYDNPSGDLGTGFWLADLATGELRQLWPQARPFTWSPDSQAITFVDDGVLYTLNVTDETAVPTPLFTHPDLVDLWVRWSPDGRWITAVTVEPAGVDETGYPQQNEVIWLVPTNGEPAFELTRRPIFAREHSVNEIAWSPDSQYLRLQQEVINLAGEVVWSEMKGWATWRPGENQLLVNRSDGLRLMTVTGEEIHRISDAHLEYWALSHDGRQVAYLPPDNEADIFLFDLETGEQRLVGSVSGDRVGSLRWTADDAYLLVGGEQTHSPIWLLAVQPGSTPQMLAIRGVLVDVVGLPDTAVPTTDLQLLARPLDCEMFESGIYDYVDGHGFATPEEAFAEFDAALRPSGEPATTITQTDSVNWIYLQEGQKVGVVTAVKEWWGLWLISSVDQCVDE